MDFSVSGVLPEGNTTLIHWIQGNFTASNCTQHFTSSSSAIAPYQPPSPPAGQTHTYGVFLYEQPAKFALSADYIPFFKNLTTSIYNRVGFNLTKFVEETGLGLPVGAVWLLSLAISILFTRMHTYWLPVSPELVFSWWSECDDQFKCWHCHRNGAKLYYISRV